MLDAWIIEKLKEEQERHDREKSEQPFLRLPLYSPLESMDRDEPEAEERGYEVFDDTI